MTLDPVHFEGIADLAGRIDQGAGERDHRAFAETVWEEFLDPLVDRRGRLVIDPIERVSRHRVDCEAVALAEPAFETCHGLDAGTINPTTFKNGLVIDVAQAAMAATPSDLDVHRSRTAVMTVHSSDTTGGVRDDGWDRFDDDYSRRRAVNAPSNRSFAEGVVHALALYLAESEHAREHASAVEELLVLDGPLYPRGLLRWSDRHPELATLLEEEPQPKTVVENYVRLVEGFVARDTPLIGFVKNPSTRAITRALSSKDGVETPWAGDSAFFTRVLERGEYIGDPEGERWERDRGSLTYTGWFRSRAGVDRPMSAEGDALGVDRELSPEAYEVTFFALYDPREDLCYRIEAPYAFTRDEEHRERLTRHVLSAVATARGPPPVVGKADELARISAAEKASLREALEARFKTEEDTSYDDLRWEAYD